MGGGRVGVFVQRRGLGRRFAEQIGKQRGVITDVLNGRTIQNIYVLNDFTVKHIYVLACISEENICVLSLTPPRWPESIWIAV
jgi:hypothetical protein